MRLKKYISIILSSILIFVLSGCGNKDMQVTKNPENNKKIEVTIDSQINEYSPLMSSTPGIPLTAKFNGSISESNIIFHWVTEQGTFLNWQPSTGKVSVLDKDIKINDQKIYWSIDPNVKIKDSSFKIYLKIENKDNSKVIYETSIEVEQNKESFFTIKK